MKQFPKARTRNLVVQEFDDELLMYDRERHQAHCLNRTAAFIWKACDGRTSIPEIGSRLGEELGTERHIDERVVWYALRQFDRDHLLEKLELTGSLLSSSGFDRRQMIKALGLSAAIALPLVTSMVAPTAAQAATCLPSGSVCQTSAQCCAPGICNNGTCL